MKRKLLFPFLFLLFSIACSNDLSNTDSNVTSQGSVPEMPADFEFSLEYGTYGKQKVDTFNEIIVKDLVIDGTMEASLSFTEEEKKLIYNEMMKMDIMGELDIDKWENCGVEPPSPSSWHIQMNGETKEFFYKDFCDPSGDALKLIELENFIHNIVISKEAYKELPEINGGYE